MVGCPFGSDRPSPRGWCSSPGTTQLHRLPQKHRHHASLDRRRVLKVIASLLVGLCWLLTVSTGGAAEQPRRSLQIHKPNAAVGSAPKSGDDHRSWPGAFRQLLEQHRPCFAFVHDVAKASTDRYDQRHYFVALTTMLDDLLRKWRFDKIGGCKSVLFTMLTTDKTYYGELAEIDLVDLQSVDNRSFDASDADLARVAEIVLLRDLYRRIRFVGRAPDSPIYTALTEFLETGYYGIVNVTEPAFEAARRERARMRGP